MVAMSTVSWRMAAAAGLVVAGWAATAAQVPPRDVTAPRQSGAVIRGVVVDGVTGAPIRRAAVSLVIEQPDRESSRVLATTADAGGQFEFTGVPAGRVQVTASRPGYFDYDNVWNGEPEEPQWQTVGRRPAHPGRAHRALSRRRHHRPHRRRVRRAGRGHRDRRAAPRTAATRRRRAHDVDRRSRRPPTTPARSACGASPLATTSSARGPTASSPRRPATPRPAARATRPPTTRARRCWPNARSVRVTAGRDTGGVAFGLVTVPLATVRGVVLLPPDIAGPGGQPRREPGGAAASRRLRHARRRVRATTAASS